MEVLSSKSERTQIFKETILCVSSTRGSGDDEYRRKISFPLHRKFPNMSQDCRSKITFLPNAFLLDDGFFTAVTEVVGPVVEVYLGVNTCNSSFQVRNLIQLRRKSGGTVQGMVLRKGPFSFLILHKGGRDTVNYTDVDGITVLMGNSAASVWKELVKAYPGVGGSHHTRPIGLEYGRFEEEEEKKDEQQQLAAPKTSSFEDENQRFMESFSSLEKKTHEPENILSLEKRRLMEKLHHMDPMLYYKVLTHNIAALAPMICKPTVGLACQSYLNLFKHSRRVLLVSRKDKGQMISMLPSGEVDIIVVTHGSHILGLHDLGVHGIGQSIGLLDMFVAAAGINPQRILATMLDVGTSNKNLLEDPLYLGVREERLEGPKYMAVVDEFLEAVYTRWPSAIVLFEDFQLMWALGRLEHYPYSSLRNLSYWWDQYHNKFCMFNDNLQGIGGVAIAGLLGALRAQNRPLSDFVKQKMVIVGSGSAWIGVLKIVKQAVAVMTESDQKAPQNPIWIYDNKGLVTKNRFNLDPPAAHFARDFSQQEIKGLGARASLLEVVKKVKPDILLGVSEVKGIFTEEVLKAMKDSGSSRPAILAMSAECTAADAFKYAGENIIFVSGSPCANVNIGNGKVGHVNQADTRVLSLGVCLGSLLSGSHSITDGMVFAGAKRLALFVTDEQIKSGIVYPSTASIRDITIQVAASVIEAAIAEKLADETLMQMSKDEKTLDYVVRNMWIPV
ncbi:hypothetical protein C5167_004129 [Papaver somniferum]|uniref:NAD-dependent malic enzyme 59 kDa isoform, mitochondrial-like n=1 Tax=Papaver somniferum TaxID=3469 RepID=UPI000E703873|nr:NAD-dependent malic enzyme 59 kDa isoform, mitochondrial-like [Papaver somniferum]RZC87950.1 hypothetical protein C5167_004129 [Papaver somniferum]